MSTEVTAHRLKMLMRERNWGVKAFANRIPADKNSVKTWLAGQYYPRYDSLVKVCELLDVSADYVVGLSDGRGSGDGGKLVFRKKVSRNGAGGKVGAGAELFAGLSAFEEGTSRLKNLC